MNRTTADIEGALHSLYLLRPDLWAFSRVLQHCKRGRYSEHAETVWGWLDEKDKDLLRQVARGEKVTRQMI